MRSKLQLNFCWPSHQSYLTAIPLFLVILQLLLSLLKPLHNESLSYSSTFTAECVAKVWAQQRCGQHYVWAAFPQYIDFVLVESFGNRKQWQIQTFVMGRGGDVY